MKKFFFGTMLLALVFFVPLPTMAGVNVNLNFALPPPVVFEAPPEVVPLPDTDNVYVVPDVTADMYFWNGWWWRPWEGRWYRSHYYDRGWAYYDNVPSFYFDVDPGWRGYYRNHNWNGHRWNYERIPTKRLNQNWRSWHNNQHWEKQRTWGIQSYKPRSKQQTQQLQQQRQKQYHQRPEVQRHQQEKQRQIQKQHPQQQHSQPQGGQHQEKSQYH